MLCIWPQASLYVPSVVPSHVSFLCSGMEAAGEGGQKLKASSLVLGSWIQASGAIVTVTIETQRQLSAGLQGSVQGFHRLTPAERGIWEVVRDLPTNAAEQGPSLVLGLPHLCLHLPLLPLLSHLLSFCHEVYSCGGSGCCFLHLEHPFWLPHLANSYLPSRPHPDAFFCSTNIC